MMLGVSYGAASAAKALPCADYVSTGIEGPPGVGHLTGTKTVTITYNVAPGGVGMTVSETFEVGMYTFGGQTLQIDCRDYTLWQF
jgi:hypothetical protein